MQPVGSFTIQFPEHLPASRVEQALAMLASCGAHVEAQESAQMLVVCENERQVNEVGVCLFHTHIQSLARVVGVLGLARGEASAYHFPTSRAERQRYR